MRPAEVWGWYRYPFSSRSLMVLRIVAADRPIRNRRATVRLPAGSAVWTYVSMTASSTWRSRSLRDAAVILPNPFRENNLRGRVPPGQVADQRVEPQPAFRGAHQPLVPDLHPAPIHPGGNGRQRAAMGGKVEALVRAQRQINALEFPLLVAEGLL